jgi:hypothetical protein
MWKTRRRRLLLIATILVSAIVGTTVAVRLYRFRNEEATVAKLNSYGIVVVKRGSDWMPAVLADRTSVSEIGFTLNDDALAEHDQAELARLVLKLRDLKVLHGGGHWFKTYYRDETADRLNDYGEGGETRDIEPWYLIVKRERRNVRFKLHSGPPFPWSP